MITPSVAPPTTSAGKCADRYIREYPTKNATINRIYFVKFCFERIDKYKPMLNAVAVWPEGKVLNIGGLYPATKCKYWVVPK